MLNVDRLVSNFYLHIPFCVKKCYFCAFPVHAVGEKTDQSQKQKSYELYCQKIEQEIKTVLDNSTSLCTNIDSLYFGGGTPSLLSGAQIRSILSYFKYGIKRETEITMEMNLQQVRKSQEFLNEGVNRISVGVQSLNRKTLGLLNRGYQSPYSVSQEQVKNNLQKLSKTTNLNLDFIIDLNSGKKEIGELAEFIGSVQPNHVSLYMLEVNEGSYLHMNPQKFAGKLGTSDGYEELSNFLSSKLGYEHYEVSNFCKPGFRSKHNSAYWLGNKPFGAFGMGATSLLNKCRITRPRNLSKYYSYVQSLDSSLKANHQIVDIHPEGELKQQSKWVIMSRLRRMEGLTWPQLKQCLRLDGTNEVKVIEKVKKQMQCINSDMQGIIDVSELDKGVKLNRPKGYLFADQICYRILECLEI